MIKEEVIPNGDVGAGQAGRERARESRLKSARGRRLRLDPDQVVRDQRIDEGVVDVELGWEARATAERAVADAEGAAATAVERLVAERLSVKDVVRLTGLDQPTVRRLRQTRVAPEARTATPEPTMAED